MPLAPYCPHRHQYTHLHLSIRHMLAQAHEFTTKRDLATGSIVDLSYGGHVFLSGDSETGDVGTLVACALYLISQSDERSDVRFGELVVSTVSIKRC